MEVGVSIRSGYAATSPREGAPRMIEEVRSAYEATLDSLFIGDHHVNASPYYQNVPMLGRLLAEWPDRDVGALFQLPLWNPVLLAEQVGTLAAATTGRFVLVAAIGGTIDQFTGDGLQPPHAPFRVRVESLGHPITSGR